jgi:transketolase N-terminal domain/subunit
MISINGKVLTKRTLTMEEMDRLEKAYDARGWTVLEVGKDGDDYEYVLKEKLTAQDLKGLREELGI